MTLPPLPVRLPRVRSKKAEASANDNAVALGTAATAFFQGAGIGASMMLVQALSDAVARVSPEFNEEGEGERGKGLTLGSYSPLEQETLPSPQSVFAFFSFSLSLVLG